MDWNEEYTAASRELELAKDQYRIADSALAVATSRLNIAERHVARLYRARMDRIEATTHT